MTDAEGLGKPLEKWLRGIFRDAGDLTVVSMRSPSNGFSARTLLVTLDLAHDGAPSQQDVVVRLEQPGHDIFLDTSILRQADMMVALSRHDLPVPRVLGVERDRAVLGGQFMVTEKIDGHALPQNPSYYQAGLLYELPPHRRAWLWQGAIETIARVNRSDWREGFRFLNKPERGAPGLDQYLNWLAAWKDEAMQGKPHEFIDVAMDYLFREKPGNAHVDVLWGDSNVGNMLFRSEGTVAAALDFEAAALGPAEIDLGWWFFMDELNRHGIPFLPGMQDRAEQIAIYENTLGRKVDALDYFETLAAVRMALVLVRTMDRLINFGTLPPTNRAALRNPVTKMLAHKLGLAFPDLGGDYLAFVEVMTKR